MKKFAALYLAFGLVVATSNTTVLYAQEVGTTPPVTVEQQVEGKMKVLAPMLGAQSIQYALIDDGELILSGDTSNTKDTLYGVGSVSKMYTTMAVMQLVEEGKIDLDTPLTTYIPEFTMADERYKTITPRMLLNHSSGLMGSTLKNTFLYEDQDDTGTTTLLDELKGQRLKANPGAYSVYCNDGFTLAEILVERVSGMSFTEYIHEHITKPLGLQNTVTPRGKWEEETLAAYYDAMTATPLPTEIVNVIGTGGVYATAYDLARFGEIYTGTKGDILTEEMIDLTKVPEYQKGMWAEGGDSSLAYGLGWDHMNAYPFSEYDVQALVKGGDTIGYHASLIVLPEEDMVAAVLSTGGASIYNQMIATDLLMTRLQEQGTITELAPVPNYGVPESAVAVPEKELSKAGYYGSMGGVLEIAILPEGQLNLSFVGMPELGTQSFIHIGEGQYVSGDGSVKITIVKEANEELYLRVDGYGQIPGIGVLPTSEYQAQKLKANPLSEKVQKAWEARNGKKYYILDEKYSSLTHYKAEQSVPVALQEALPGYFMNMMITGENEAKSVVQIPGNYGRDVSDVTFFEKEGVEYAKIGCYLAISEDALPTLNLEKEQKVVIEKDGYAKWHKITPESAGKVIKVEESDNASFAIYDAAGILVTFSRVHGVDEIALPEGGMILFAGDSGSTFKVAEVK